MPSVRFVRHCWRKKEENAGGYTESLPSDKIPAGDPILPHRSNMQALLTLLPILVFLVLWVIFYEARAEWRSSFLSASVVWTVFLVAVTELLSLFHAITLVTVLALWFAALLIALAWIVSRMTNIKVLWRLRTTARLSSFEWALVGGCSFIALVTALIAWVAPPNTFDSLAYHMPRVMHWIQDQSVAYYPTAILRQLYIAPGTEFIILHFQLLAGSDRLASFVQWFSMVGSAVGVSLIAKELGIDRRGQLLSAVASMTIPMGILQATSTQTDYVVAFWLACFVYWMLSLVRGPGIGNVSAAGASLGLAALTKSTTYIFALPFLVWFGIWLLMRYRFKSLAFWAAIAAIFLLINAGVYARNMQLFGNPVGIVSGSTRDRLSNELFGPSVLISNVVRNLSLDMATPSAAANAQLQKAIVALHERMGLSVNDRRTTYAGTSFAVVFGSNENSAGNPLQLLLLVLGAAFVLGRPGNRRLWLVYIGCLLLAFGVFCFYLKWQPWNTRLQLVLFVLAAPLLGKAMSGLHPRWLGNALAVLLVLSALPWLFFNSSRPLVGSQNILNTDRTSLYFQSLSLDAKKSYASAVAFFARQTGGQCSRVGLDLGQNDLEYPLWVLLPKQVGRSVWMDSVGVQNISRNLPGVSPAVAPCAIFVWSPAPRGDLHVGGRAYANAYTNPALSVFLPR